MEARPENRDSGPSLPPPAAALLLAALWLATRPYQGIFHDARLYTLQALARSHPGRYDTDLFLAYGSQDQFSVFASLYAPALALLGNAGGNMAVLATCALLWLMAALAFSRRWFGAWPAALAATATVIALPGGIAFPYGEPYLSPRLPAEALTMFALALMVGRRPLAALATLAVAMAIHPLMAIPGIGLWFLVESRGRPWLWALALFGVLAVGAAAWTGIEPFARLGQRFDPAWFAVVASRNPHCLVSRWTEHEWVAAANILAAAALALGLGRRETRPLLLAAIAVGFVGLLVAWAGGDILRNVLLTDLQAWRWTWLTAVTAHLCLGVLLYDVARGDVRLSRLELGLLITVVTMLVVSRFVYQTGALAAPVMLALAGIGHWRRRTGAAPPRWVAIIVIYLVIQLLVLALGLSVGPRGLAVVLSPTAGMVASAALCLALLGGIVMLAISRGTAALTVLAGLALIATALAWDQRTPWRHYVDNVSAPPAGLVAMLPKGPIYWEGDMTAPWLMLQRPSYFSCDQGAGVLFARGTASVYRARAESLGRLRPLDFRQYDFCPMPATAPAHTRGAAELAAVCRREPDLAALVLASPVPGASGQIWAPPVPFELPLSDGSRFVTRQFHIYRCADYR